MNGSARVRVLVIDDEENIRRTLKVCLESAGYTVTLAASGEAGVAAARRAPPGVVLADLRLGGMDGLAVTRLLVQEVPAAPVVIMTAYASVDTAVEAMRAGAVDFLPKPFNPPHVLHVVGKALEGARLRQELAEMRAAGQRVQPTFDSRNAAYRDAVATALRVAPTDATVLLTGETGTGKGVLARHLHAVSPRGSRPFVTVNCAVVSPGLIENELFGHVRGAFTGADSVQAGHVERAGNGTLFLDEVGELPREAQGKLLRLLEEHEYSRVGDPEPRQTEVRVVAATHRDLQSGVASGAFREDLYYRLDVVTIRVPPLRERIEDLPALAAAVVGDLARQHHRPPLTLAPETFALLAAHRWPGNLRELVNVLERAVIFAQGTVVTPDLLREDLRALAPPTGAMTDGDESLEAAERRHIARVLARHPTLDAAARALGIDPSTLYRKRERYGLL